ACRALLGARDDGVAATRNGSARRAHRRNDARSDPREHCEQPQQATLAARQTAPLLISHTRSCGTNPRISVATQTSTTAAALPPPTTDPATAGADRRCAVDTTHSI